MDGKIEVLGQEWLSQGFMKLAKYTVRHERFDGSMIGPFTREIILRTTAVGVLPYDPIADKILLIEQFRLAAHLAGFPAWQLEVVAGIVDHAGEGDAEVARREAQEEAGLIVEGELRPIHRYMTSPGGTTETVTLFCGRVDSRHAGGVHGLATEHEDIKVAVKSYRAALRLIRADKIINGITLLALYWLVQNRSRLRREWR